MHVKQIIFPTPPSPTLPHHPNRSLGLRGIPTGEDGVSFARNNGCLNNAVSFTVNAVDLTVIIATIAVEIFGDGVLNLRTPVLVLPFV